MLTRNHPKKLMTLSLSRGLVNITRIYLHRGNKEDVESYQQAKKCKKITKMILWLFLFQALLN